MMRKVYLEGELGEKYGKELTMNVESFSEALRCLDANFPDFRKYLLDCHEKGIGFICEVGEESLDAAEFSLLHKKGDMLISPQPAGAKSNWLKIIVGAAMVYISMTTGPIGPTVLGGTTGLGNVALFFGGMQLANYGIQSLMAPDPSVDGFGSGEDDSYLYQGTGQTVYEGDPVPLVYGRLRVPGRPVSFRIKNRNQLFYNGGSGVRSASDINITDSDEVEFPTIPPDSVYGTDLFAGPAKQTQIHTINPIES